MSKMGNKPLVTFAKVLNTYKSKFHGREALKKYKQWFPIYPSSGLAGIVADLIFDGHLQLEPKLRLDYTSKSKNELRRFEAEIYNIFKLNGKIRACTSNKFSKTYNYGVNCKPLARVLILLGVPTGAKVLKPFRVPRWIIKNEHCFRIFVKRMFDCEGSIWNKKYSWIGIEMWKERRLIKNGIEFFNDIR